MATYKIILPMSAAHHQPDMAKRLSAAGVVIGATQPSSGGDMTFEIQGENDDTAINNARAIVEEYGGRIEGEGADDTTK